VAESYSAAYRGRGPADFFGMIVQIDENVGKLDAFLRETRLRDDTILIFMTDNGGTAGVKTFNAGLRGGKTTFYEGGHRVPCWIRWPAGDLGPPRDIDVPAQVQDILPTLLDLCGVPKAKAGALDGASLAALLRGAAEGLPERMCVVQYSRARLEKWECAVIWDRWRLVEGKELYDVRADRAQAKDLAALRPDIAAKMRKHYEGWWAALGPKVEEFVPAATLGSERQPLVKLTSSDWQDVYCDNAGHIRSAAGGPRGGWWNLLVERTGDYDIALRRWPREVDLPLGEASGAGSRALRIAAARVSVAGGEFPGEESSAMTAPTEREVSLRVRLPAGPVGLQAWFQDAEQRDLSGAFYAYIRRAD
jgi:arylsulfatase